MLVSHEIPKQLFEVSQLFNDYPYALGHLLNKDERYTNFYRSQLGKAPFSILDNSAFELGESMDVEEFAKLIKEFIPTHYILPDKLHDSEATLKMAKTFLEKNSNLNSTAIGVLQGNSFEELIDCYNQYLKMGITYIAIPFDCIKDSDWSNVRFLFFRELIKKMELGTIIPKFHFLGLQSPQEMLLYSEGLKQYITSIDSSSPIIHGWNKNKYTSYGCLQPKPKEKLADNLDRNISPEEMEVIIHNIKTFRTYVRY